MSSAEVASSSTSMAPLRDKALANETRWRCPPESRGELPVLGVLFRGSERQRDKRELLLFVTPKILKETLQLER